MTMNVKCNYEVWKPRSNSTERGLQLLESGWFWQFPFKLDLKYRFQLHYVAELSSPSSSIEAAECTSPILELHICSDSNVSSAVFG